MRAHRMFACWHALYGLYEPTVFGVQMKLGHIHTGTHRRPEKIDSRHGIRLYEVAKPG